MKKQVAFGKRTNKALALISFLIAALVFFGLFFFFAPSSFANQPFLSMLEGASGVIPIAPEEWGDNTRLMQETADQLGIHYSDSSPDSLTNAMSQVDSSKLSHVKKLNLSGLQMTELPPVLKHYTGLESLDLSHNQLSHLPDYLVRRTDLSLNAEWNLLPENFGYDHQYQLYVLAIQSEAYQNMMMVDTFDESALLSLVKESLWLEAPLPSGGNSIQEPSPHLVFALDYNSLKDQNGMDGNYYINAKSNHILREGIVTGTVYLTNPQKTVKGLSFPFTLKLAITDKTPVPPSVWVGQEGLRQQVMTQLGVASPEEITSSLLDSITDLSFNDPKTTVLPEILQLFPKLEKLDLSGSRITDLHLIAELSSVTQLSLANCELTAIPSSLLGNPFLTSLNLSGNHLPLEAFSGLASFPQLKKLDLSHNDLKEIPLDTPFPPALTSLLLQNNLFTSYPAALSQLKNVTFVDLSFNQITSLPQEVEALFESKQWLIDDNLLPPTFPSDQRHLIALEKDLRFSFTGSIDWALLSQEVHRSLSLSDGAPLSPTLPLRFCRLDGSPLSDGAFLSTDGIILKNLSLRILVKVDGTENNANAQIPITLALAPAPEASEALEQARQNEIAAAPPIFQSALTDLTTSTMTEVSSASHTPETIPSIIFQTIEGTEKDYTFTVNKEDGLSYSWTFLGTHVQQKDDVLSGIQLNSDFDETIKNRVSVPFQSIHFENHGALPGNASIKITFPSKKLLRQGIQYLYHYNEETGALEYEGTAFVKGQTLSFVINHTSIYLVSEKPIRTAENNPPNLFFSPNPLQILLCISTFFVLLVGIIGICHSISLTGPSSAIPEEEPYVDYLLASKKAVEPPSSALGSTPPVSEKGTSPTDHSSNMKNQLLRNEIYRLPHYPSSSFFTTSMPAVNPSYDHDVAELFARLEKMNNNGE